MKLLRLIFFFFLFNFCIAQEKISYVKIDLSCEMGIKKAEEDIDNGIYKILSYGLIVYKDSEFESFYNEFVKNKYEVILGTGGCIVNDFSDCYTKKMRDAVFEKFGKDFFEKSRKEARTEYNTILQP